MYSATVTGPPRNLMMDARCASSPRRCFVASSPPCACSMARNRPVRSMATSARRVLPSGPSSPRSAPQPCAIGAPDVDAPSLVATRRGGKLARGERRGATRRADRGRERRRSRRAHARRGVVRASARRRGERRARDPSEPAHRARPAVGLARNRRLKLVQSTRQSGLRSRARFRETRDSGLVTLVVTRTASAPISNRLPIRVMEKRGFDKPPNPPFISFG